MSACTNYRVEVDGCVDGIKTVAVEVYAGLQGATGPSGQPSTIPGATGATGPQGASGEPSTVPGATGATGPSGLRGASGEQGIQGNPGESVIGATGPRGATGPSGLPGEVGASGAQGPAGNVGPTGPTGPQGIAGDVGATGATGPSGQPSTVAGATGATGPSGTVGATGPMPSAATVTTQISRFTGDGTTSVFSPITGFQSGDTGARYFVQLDGVEQDPDPTNGAFVIASNQITFASAVPFGTQIVVRRLNVSLS